MKVYIASSFKLIPKVVEVATTIEKAGHSITVKWWDRAFDIPSKGLIHTVELKESYALLTPTQFYNRDEVRSVYLSDREGIKNCDVFIFVADDKPVTFNGASVELGMADAWDKACFLIGKLENSALFYRLIQCDDLDKIIKVMKLLEGKK